jgi:hypothetical protein
MKLNNRIDNLNIPSQQSSLLYLQSDVDFYKEQMQTLIWILGVIIAATGTVLLFFGFHTHKSIEDKCDREFQELLKLRDKKIYEKRIVFLYMDNDENLRSLKNEINDRGYIAGIHKITDFTDVKRKTEDASVVIYKAKSSNDALCTEISDYCERKETHCIIYCPDVNLSNQLFERNSLYFSTSKQITKLRESIYILLYLTP